MADADATRPLEEAGAGVSAPPPVPEASPYAPEIREEHAGWDELQGLLRRLTPWERLEPGYYRDPDWSVKDLVAHIGTWLAEAEVQIERIQAGTYEAPPTDIDAMNARFLEAMRDQPWPVVSTQATAARTQMLRAWYAVRTATAEASWWVRKAGADHYDEHLPRLRDWVEELAGRRGAPEG